MYTLCRLLGTKLGKAETDGCELGILLGSEDKEGSKRKDKMKRRDSQQQQAIHRVVNG